MGNLFYKPTPTPISTFTSTNFDNFPNDVMQKSGGTLGWLTADTADTPRSDLSIFSVNLTTKVINCYSNFYSDSDILIFKYYGEFCGKLNELQEGELT